MTIKLIINPLVTALIYKPISPGTIENKPYNYRDYNIDNQLYI